MRVAFLDLKEAHRELACDLDAAFRRVISSGVYILGEEVDAFEREWADYCGTSDCVGVGSGFDALCLVLRAWEIGPGDEVIVPSNTYIATWLAVSHCGATPVPVEPVLATRNLDPDRLEAAITSRTRAIIPVHLYGLPAEMGPILEIAGRHGLKVLEDAAQAHGATLDGRRCGSLGDAAAWSFYPSKNLGAIGDGGAVTTDDTSLGETIRVLRNHGSPAKYSHTMQGVNSRLDPLQAAFLREKLHHLDLWNERRRKVAKRYSELFFQVANLELPPASANAEPSWHLFVVRHPRRDALAQRLAENGIATLVHYPVPPHRARAYAGTQMSGASLEIADALSETVLSLPIGPHLGVADVDRVCEAVRSFCKHESPVGNGFG